MEQIVMEIYLVMHHMNEECQSSILWNVIEAHTTLESAKAKVERINEEIQQMKSPYFDGYVPQTFKHCLRDGYTYKWEHEGATMYSHITIQKTKLYK